MTGSETGAASGRQLLVERSDGVATLTLNRPEKHNALTQALMDELRQTLESIGPDEGVKVVVLGARGKAFCAGHDFAEVKAAGDRAARQRVFDSCSALMLAINRIPQPVIAKVQGLATGAGCQLVAACDLAVAAEEARLATSGINVGLFCSTPSVALGRNVAPKQAMEMLFTGEFIDAETASRYGLLNRSVAADQLDAEVAALARRIAGKAPSALRLGKEVFYRQLGMELADAYAYASRVMVDNLEAPDCQEGISAFTEKRPPSWSQD